jgi:hypothetical protein
MRTLHVLILAGAILGAGWMLKPVPVKQVSRAELERREKLERFMQEPDQFASEEQKRCAASIGKKGETIHLEQLDPKQQAVYDKCMQREPQAPRGRMRMLWDKICGTW